MKSDWTDRSTPGLRTVLFTQLVLVVRKHLQLSALH